MFAPLNQKYFYLMFIFYLIVICVSVNSQRYSSCGRRPVRTGVVARQDNRNRNAPKPADSENLARRDDFPWHVSIFRRPTPKDSFVYKCGGTLISPLGNNQEIMVITSAHCLTGGNGTSEEPESNLDTIRIILGPSSSNLNGNSDQTGSQRHYVKHLEINPNYQFQGLKSDIALIQLRDKVRLTKYTQPLCFPVTKTEDLRLLPGVIGEVAGFGWDPHRNISSVMRFAEMKIFSASICQERFEKKINHFLEFCAGHQHESAVCHSDSGGALAVEYPKESGQYLMQGILSSTAWDEEVLETNGLCLNYNIFTHISPFVEWVQTVQEKLLKVPLPTEATPPKQPVVTVPTGTNPLPAFVRTPAEYMRVSLDLHNHYRKRHSAPPVKLNEQMILEAQSLAEYLVETETLEQPSNSEYSTNLFAIQGELSPPDAVREAMQFWYRSSLDYDKEEPRPSAFTQLVWKASTQIGTGVATNGERTVVVVYFWPKGNQYYTGGRKSERTKSFHENVKPAVKGF